MNASNVRLINARSAGIAIGMLKRDQGEVYQGIMLDFDLQMRPITETDLRMDGDDVVRAINQYVSKSVPILIHSMNRTEPGRVVNELEAHGYFVTRIPMSRLTEGAFLDWVEHVRE